MITKRFLNVLVGVILMAIIGYAAGSYFGNQQASINNDLSNVEGIEPYSAQGKIKSFENGVLVINDRELLQEIEYKVTKDDLINFIDTSTEELVEDADLSELQPGRIASVRSESDVEHLIIDVFTIPDFEKIKAENPGQ